MGIPAGFRVLSAVDLSGRRMLASDGGSAEVSALHEFVIYTGVALLLFGAVKGRLAGVSIFKSSVQTLLVGALAAGSAFFLASRFG